MCDFKQFKKATNFIKIILKELRWNNVEMSASYSLYLSPTNLEKRLVDDVNYK